MADFVALWESRHGVIERLEALKREAEADRETLERSALRIQCLFKGSVTRADLTVKRSASTQISRLARGAAARRAADRERTRRKEQEELALRNYCATNCQKVFRGFHSRKFQHDYYARKHYIEDIQAKSESLRAELEVHLQQQVLAEHTKEDEKARKEFQTVTQGFHHLVSTKSIPGVFNPPYARSIEEVPTAFGVPMETHLRVGVKTFLRTRGLRKSRAAPSYATTRQTLRSQGVFGSEVEEERHAKKLSALNQTTSRPFTGGGTAKVFDPISTFVPGVNSQAEYEENWKSSRGMRDRLNEPDMKAKRVSEAPFYVSVPKGKVFEDVERQRSREAANRGRRLMGTSGSRGVASRGAGASRGSGL